VDKFAEKEKIYTEDERGRRLIQILVRDDVFARLTLDACEIGEIVPETQAMVGFDQRNPHHPYDAWIHTAHCVACADPIPVLRLAMLMHDLGKPETFYMAEDEVGHFNHHEKRGEEIARSRLPELGFDADTVDTVALLVGRHDKGIAETDLQRWIDEFGMERFQLLLDVKEADARSHDAKYKNYQLAKVASLRHLLKASSWPTGRLK